MSLTVVKRQKILVVDDERTSRLFVVRCLESQGYQIEAVSSGAEGLVACANEPPDLVVSDVMMPQMDGLEFCRRLRHMSSARLIPFIFLSGKGEVEDRIEGHSIGADDYLVKPINPTELLAKIEAHLERLRRIHSEIVRLTGGLAQFNNAQAIKVATPLALPLTPAEQRVFREVIQGLTNKQIAAQLFISPRTAQTHVRNILNKLHLHNRHQLIHFAYEQGYL